MKPLEPAIMIQKYKTWQCLKKALGTKEYFPDDMWQKQFERMNRVQIFKNDKYQVVKDVIGPYTHLSIKRLDQEVIRDWRDLQEIKNQMLGEEAEAVELFPAESRLVDSCNQFHLWAINDPEFKWPFGYQERLVIDGDGTVQPDGTKQRPFNKEKYEK